MRQKQIALYKLMILYLLDLTDYPLSDSRLVEFMVGHHYVDYFQFRQTVGELADAEYITRKKSHHMTRYHITDSGRDTLSLFRDNLAEDLTGDMNSWIKEKGYEIRRETEIAADYYPVKRGRREEYLVEAHIKEKGELMMKLTLNVVSREQAAHICDNWTEKSDQVYSHLIDLLLLEKEE